jgi:chromosomal replication initiation ATPase DnaA
VSSHPKLDETQSNAPLPDPKFQDQQLELGEEEGLTALRRAWERTLRALAGSLNKQTIDNWLRPLKPLSYSNLPGNSVAVLGAPSSFAREFAEKKYARTLTQLLAQHLDAPDIQVRFVISTPEVQPLLGENPLPLQQAAAPQSATMTGESGLPIPASLVTSAPEAIFDGASSGAKSSRNPFALELSASPLVPRYTFDNFVVGKSNRLAQAGAVAVAQSPGATYNPLFLYGSPGLGKCVAASEYLYLADGRRIRAGELIGTDFSLLTVAKEEIRAVPARAEFNAVEPVFAITTESGRRIVRNGQHPLWAANGVAQWGKRYHSVQVHGWTPLKNIESGDLVAVPESLPAFGAPVALPEHEIKLLAYLIGDGGFSQPCVRFSQQDNVQLAEFKECVAQTNCRMIQHSKYDWRIVGRRGRVAAGKDSRNDVMNLLRRHGLMLTHSRDKRIPAAIFQLSRDQLCLFLSRLFATDGWASCGNGDMPGNRLPRTEIGFCSASEGLVRDIQELLLKLGILSRLSRKANVNAWTLALHAASEVVKFSALVGIFGKEDAVERVRQVAERALVSCPNRGEWRHRNAPLGMRWEKVVSILPAGIEATVAVEVPDYQTFLSTFWEHNTHLMHAIGHQIRLALPQARVVYVSGEMFTNHYVTAIRDKRTEDFRRAYRNVDVWLVDDIQTLASKEQTKEEFFHTFNALHQMNKQIVLTSDRSPRELRAMDERLWSRFECGLVADIASPELEMRQAILQKKAILENLAIPDEVIAFMANLIQSNIRALEGALIKLMAYASLAKSPVTKQLASDVLSSYYVERITPREMAAREQASREMVSAHPEDQRAVPSFSESALQITSRSPMSAGGPTVDRIIESIAAQMGVTRDLIIAGGGRSNRATRLYGDANFARQIAMYVTKELGGVPLSTLAATFGLKSHTAIVHAHARLQKELESDPQILSLISKIRQEIERES